MKTRAEILKRQSEWYFKNKNKLKPRYDKYRRENREKIKLLNLEYCKKK